MQLITRILICLFDIFIWTALTLEITHGSPFKYQLIGVMALNILSSVLGYRLASSRKIDWAIWGLGFGPVIIGYFYYWKRFWKKANKKWKKGERYLPS